MLGRITDAAEPDNGAAVDDVVEPGLPDLLRTQVRVVVVVGQGAQKGERPGKVVVGDSIGRFWNNVAAEPNEDDVVSENGY